MTENVNPFRDIKSKASARTNGAARSDSADGPKDAIELIRARFDRLVEDFNFQQLSQKVQDFGRQNPMALALSALTLGIVAGVMMRGKFVGGLSEKWNQNQTER